MTTKEITLIGMALKTLIKVGATEEVNEIINYMASTEKPREKDE